MPIIQVPADVFMRHNGVTIFQAYKEDDTPVDEPQSFWYSFSSEGTLDFDVRDLPVPDFIGNNTCHMAIIRHALDNDLLTPPANDDTIEHTPFPFPVSWIPFDYNAFEPGFAWVSFTSPVFDVDQDDDGRLQGAYTGEMRSGTALVYIDDEDGFATFNNIDRPNLGYVDEHCTVTHYAEFTLPSAAKS